MLTIVEHLPYFFCRFCPRFALMGAVLMNPPASPFRVRAGVGVCRAKRLAQDEGKSGQLFRRH
jgi:hypothetical protein